MAIVWVKIWPVGEVVEMLMLEEGPGMCHPGILMLKSNGADELTV